MSSITRRVALGATATALTATALTTAAARAQSTGGGTAQNPTDIDLYFPVQVQGKLAKEMQSIIDDFNHAHPGIRVTPSYTGSYDQTSLKTRTAIRAGHPPACVIMSANFVREYVINGDIESFDSLIEADGQTTSAFMDNFWPALKVNAMIDGSVYGVPFQNSTPLLYYNKSAFKAAGLNPNQPPKNWAELLTIGRKLTGGGKHGLVMPSSYDYCGWLTSAFVMANGGQYFNWDYGGEVFYDAPSSIGALKFLEMLTASNGIMPQGEMNADAVSAAFFSGQAAMTMLSTGALGFIRENMKSDYGVAFMPKKITNAAPIGGASLIVPKGNSKARQQAAWTLIKWLTSPKVSGSWSRFTGYFAPNKNAYKLPDMQAYITQYPDAKVALEQLVYARPWFATYQTVAVREAMENQVQALISGRIKAEDAAHLAQHNATAIMAPYVAATALKIPG